jgi:Domain of unknown function (DUF4174)
MTIYAMFFTAILFSTSFVTQDYSKRKILLLAEHNQNTDLKQQQKILSADSAGLADRDIIVAVITPASDENRYDQLTKNKIGFRLILIGKDGGEKLTSDKPVTLQQLYGLIDSMPMRKYEIETRSKLAGTF